MSTQPGLTPFLTYLTTFPTASDALRACVFGPLARLDVGMASLRVADGAGNLALVASHGWSTSEEDRFRLVPLAVEQPATRALLHGEIVQTANDDQMERDFPALELESSIHQGVRTRGLGGTVACVPIKAHGFPIGVYCFISRTRVELTAQDLTLLEGVGAAFSLWLSNTDTQRAGSFRTRGQVADDVPLSLSERQLQILTLVERGKTGPAIAEALGYSLSTIKQELQRAARALRVHSRHDTARRARELGLLS